MARTRKATVTVSLEGKDGGNDLSFTMDITHPDRTESSGNMELECVADIIAEANMRIIRRIHSEFHETIHFLREN